MSSVYTNFSPFSSMTARAAVASVIFFSIMVTSATGTAVWKVTSAPYSVFSILISFVDKQTDKSEQQTQQYISEHL